VRITIESDWRLPEDVPGRRSNERDGGSATRFRWSARDERSTRHFLDHYGLSPFFSGTVTTLTARHTKPYPDPIFFAAERMGVPPGARLMIGDTTVDSRAGVAADAHTVGVLCGFGEER
jgi:beta-phosphoglucomutase-like phosphatase (HAD superfamily)